MAGERDSLITENLALAYAIANRFAHTAPSIPPDDIEGAALLGLTIAAARFDPARRCKFSTFAWTTIRGTIINEIRRETHRGHSIEYSDPLDEDGETNLADARHSAATLDAQIDARARIRVLKRRLDRRSKRIIEMYFEQDLLMREIAERQGLSEGLISCVIAEALETMRASFADCPISVRRRVRRAELDAMRPKKAA